MSSGDCVNINTLSAGNTDYVKVSPYRYYNVVPDKGIVQEAGNAYDDNAKEPWGAIPKTNAYNIFPTKNIKLVYSFSSIISHNNNIPFKRKDPYESEMQDDGTIKPEDGTYDPIRGYVFDTQYDKLGWFLEFEDVGICQDCIQVNTEELGFLGSEDNLDFFQIDANTQVFLGNYMTDLGSKDWIVSSTINEAFPAKDCDLDTSCVGINIFGKKEDFCNVPIQDLKNNAIPQKTILFSENDFGGIFDEETIVDSEVETERVVEGLDAKFVVEVKNVVKRIEREPLSDLPDDCTEHVYRLCDSCQRARMIPCPACDIEAKFGDFNNPVAVEYDGAYVRANNSCHRVNRLTYYNDPICDLPIVNPQPYATAPVSNVDDSRIFTENNGCSAFPPTIDPIVDCDGSCCRLGYDTCRPTEDYSPGLNEAPDFLVVDYSDFTNQIANIAIDPDDPALDPENPDFPGGSSQLIGCFEGGGSPWPGKIGRGTFSPSNPYSGWGRDSRGYPWSFDLGTICPSVPVAGSGFVIPSRPRYSVATFQTGESYASHGASVSPIRCDNANDTSLNGGNGIGPGVSGNGCGFIFSFSIAVQIRAQSTASNAFGPSTGISRVSIGSAFSKNLFGPYSITATSNLGCFLPILGKTFTFTLSPAKPCQPVPGQNYIPLAGCAGSSFRTFKYEPTLKDLCARNAALPQGGGYNGISNCPSPTLYGRF